jgi:uncharacterized protein YcfJ
MRRWKTLAVGISALALLEGCAGTPAGPTVQVMPAPNKPFEVFQQDQAVCKQYASQQVQGEAEAANERAVGGTLLGAGLGAGLGAAVGGGRGAAIGAASGGVLGTAVGADSSARGQYGIQRQYDNAYAQCMVAKGNQVVQPAPTVVYTPPPPPAYYYPPPPPPVVYAPPPPPPPVMP